MGQLVSERLRRNNKSMVRNVIIIIILIVIMNYCITLTNYLKEYRNLVSIFIVLFFCIMISYFVFRKASIYVYTLTSEGIEIDKVAGKKKKNIFKIDYSSILKIDKYENMQVNNKIKKSFYCIYGVDKIKCYYCEYIANGNLYRLIFSPSERLLRILERKVDKQKNGRG